jgi:integrase
MARPSKPWFRASKGTWYVKIGGKQHSLGVRGRENRSAAIAAWHRLASNGPQQPRPTVTVGELIRQFLDDVRARAQPDTLRVYSWLLLPFAAEHGTIPAADLSPVAVERYTRRPTWSPSTRNNFLTALVAACRWAVRAKLVACNPIAGVTRPPKRSRGAESVISPDAHQRLLALAEPHFRDFLTVLHATGARPGEVAAITAADVDWDAGTVTLDHHKTAHRGLRRVVYLPPDIVTLLRRLAETPPAGPLLLSAAGTPWKGNTVVKAMRRLRKRAGVPHATAYGYRHTFATDALSNGVPEAHVAELLGHAGTAMLHKHYSHLSARSALLREALGRVR